ncbi:MAG: nucleoside hydrolase [Chloroflexota bacterium]
MSDRIALLVDCDTGIDDALALLYLAASPDADLCVVTCTGGNVDARQVAANTRAVLALAGRADVPVALGREAPLVRPLVTTPETHGPQGIGDAVLPPPAQPLAPESGPDRIVAEARRRPGALTLLTLAPLTDLAVALAQEPRLPWLLRRVVIMAGAFGGDGNTQPTTEWNATVDPEALAAVLDAFRPEAAPAGSPAPPRPTIVPLDVTERHRIVPADLDALAAYAGCGPGGRPLRPGDREDAVVRFVADALRFYFAFHAEYDAVHGAYIHDAFAAAIALDPRLARTQPLTVDVETAGRLTAGETIADRRHRWGRPPNADVVTWADGAAFHARFLQRLAALARARQTGAA